MCLMCLPFETNLLQGNKPSRFGIHRFVNDSICTLSDLFDFVKFVDVRHSGNWCGKHLSQMYINTTAFPK